MSRYIDADLLIEAMGEEPYVWTDSDDEIAERNQWLTDMHIIENAPSIDLADYVPKDFHDKTCEAMAKAHQEEIANMVSVVRCKECDMSEVYQNDSSGVMARYCRAFTPTRMVADDDFCSYGERKE